MDNIRGAVLMVLSMLGFAIEDMFIKMMAGAVPIGQILILLGAGGGLIFGTVVRLQGQRLFDPAMRSGAILLRAAGEMIGTVGFVSAIILIPISTASAILQATPLVVTLGAALFFAEPVGWRRWSAIVAGFLGVLLIIRPGLDGFSALSILAVIGVLGLATRDLATRQVTSALSSMQLSFLGFIVIIPAGALLMLATGTPLEPLTLRSTFLICASLGIGVFAYYAIVAATRIGEISFISPFRYSRLIFALIVGVVVFGERPDSATLAGAAIIVASGIYTVWRERKLGRPVKANLSNPGRAG